MGDMHLGRAPARLPQALTAHGPDARTLGPGEAWRRTVDFALRQRVHAVALAGDLVNGDNALFEAYGALHQGVERLVKAGIQVCAVAGNHDTTVLPRLAGVIGPSLRILGEGGAWSEHLLAPDGCPPLRLVGWSFPRPHHEQSPLQTPPPPPRPELPTLGLVHADLDAARSRYAPVSSTLLKAVGYQGWLLGHVHRPDPPATDGTPFYLGSLTPLDPTETGGHGPVLASVGADGTWRAERILLAPLRWEHLDLDCAGACAEESDLPTVLLQAMHGRLESLGRELAEVKAAGFRVALRGRVADPAALRRAVAKIAGDQEDGTVVAAARGDLHLFLESLSEDVGGAYDLRTLAERGDPVGLLARKVLALQDPDAGVPGLDDPHACADSLVRQALDRARRLAQGPVWQAGADLSDPYDRARARDLLLHAGRLALDHLLSIEEVARAAR